MQMALLTSWGCLGIFRAPWAGGDSFGRTSVPGALWLQGDNLGAYGVITLWPCISPEAVSSVGATAEE